MTNKHGKVWRHIYVTCIICLTVQNSSAETISKRWSGISWMELYSSTTSDSKVLEHLAINSPVQLIADLGKWCEIDVPNTGIHGFCKCNSLVSAPLTLDEIGSSRLRDGTINPHYSPDGSFWLAPSMHRLIDVGNYFWDRQLSNDQKHLEHPALNDLDPEKAQATWQKSEDRMRHPVPEFDAMKNLLESGVVSADENRPVIGAFKELIEAERMTDRSIKNAVGSYSVNQNTKRLLQSVTLVSIKASLFTNERELAPAWSTIEELSAQFGIKEHMRVLGGPQWVSIDDEGPHVAGSWDIGSYALVLAQPVFRHVINRDGQKVSTSFIPLEHHDISQRESNCREGFMPDREGVTHVTSSSGNENLKQPEDLSPAIWFYTSRALPDTQIIVKTYGQIIDMPIHANGNNQQNRHVLVITYSMDLDADGVPDVAQLEISEGDEYGDSPSELLTLANIAGAWTLLSIEHNNSDCD
ncbi:MAG: hypothetical protein ABUS47_00435 [Steroidobacter sp.]